MDEILKASDTKWGYIPSKEDKEKVRFKPDHLMLSGDGIFHTIQGEWNWIWRQTTFIRLHMCNLQCSWCFVWGTPIMMADGTYKNIEDIQVWDMVFSHKGQKIQISGVENVYKRMSKTVTVIMENWDELQCTPDHVFYTNRRTWNKWAQRCEAKNLKGKDVKYFHWFPNKIELEEKYRKWYLKGAYVGDWHITPWETHLQFQVCDKEYIEAIANIMNENWANVSIRESSRKTKKNKIVYRLSSGKKSLVSWVLSPLVTRYDWLWYVAWFFDAEGSTKRNQISMSQKDQNVLGRIKQFLESEGIQVSDISPATRSYEIHINGKRNVNKFFDIIPVQISRKLPRDERKVLSNVKVVDVIPSDIEVPVYDIQTTVWNFFAKNYQVENCDARYTRKSDTEEFYKEPFNIHINELLAHIFLAQQDKGLYATRCKNVTITGWEPLMQQKTLEKWLQDAYFSDWEFQIETNGTIMPSDWMLMTCKYNCSPKLLSSDNPHKRAYKKNVLIAISERSKDPCFKFVFRTKKDIEEVLENYSFLPKEQIYMMPEWVRVEENMKVYEECIDYLIWKWLNTTPRLQNICFDGARRAV